MLFLSLLATVQPFPLLISITKFPPHTPPSSFTIPSLVLTAPRYSNQRRRIFESPMQNP